MLLIILCIVFSSVVPVQASTNMTRGEFAVKIAPMLSQNLIAYQGEFADVSSEDSYADAVKTVSFYGVMQGSDGNFYPNDALTNEETAVILVKLFELRCGLMDAPALATYFDDFFDISPWARPYLNKAVMINAIDRASGNNMLPQQPVTEEKANTYFQNTVNAINNMISYGLPPVIKSFKVNGSAVGSVQSSLGQKVDFVLTVNDTSKLPYDKATILFAVYDGNQLVSTSINRYQNIKQNDFVILQGSGKLPDFDPYTDRNRYRLKAFIWDDAATMVPLEIENVLK